MSPNLFMPALLAGLVIGVLSSLPIVSAGNCCCCAWIVGGGALGAWLLQQNSARAITIAEGMLVGLIAGVIGAVVSVPVALVVQMVMPTYGDPGAALDWMLERSGPMPPELRDAFERARESTASTRGLVGLLLTFIFALVVNLIFATLGGLLGALFFRRGPEPSNWAPADGGPPPPPPPPVPPATI